MAYINEALKILLSNNSPLDNHKDQNAAIAALNAILDAGAVNSPESTSKFRQAVRDQHSFWNPLLQGFNGLNNPPISGNEDPADNNDFLAFNGHITENNNFAQLTRLAAYKSAQLSLKKANGNQLQEIIKQNMAGADNQKAFREKFFNNDGQSVFAGTSLTVKNWDPVQNTSLPNEWLPFLKQTAQQEFLLRKIAQSTNLTKLNALLIHQNQDEFTRAVRDLFGLPAVGNAQPITDEMVSDEVLVPQVRHQVAKKSLSLIIQDPNHLSDESVLVLSLDLLNTIDSQEFLTSLELLGDEATTSANALGDAHPNEYMNEIKGSLGTRFIALKASELKIADKDLLVNVASSTELNITQELLNTHPQLQGNGPDPYTKHAVTSSSLPNIRQAYATQALKLQIAQSADLDALDSLIKITDVSALRKVFSEHDSLEFKDKAKFGEAFTATTDLNAIIAVAHIRKNLFFSNNSQQLKNLVIAGNFKTSYHTNFSAGIKPETQNAINAYFSNPDNVTNAREQALVTFAGTELSLQNNDSTIMRFINAATAEEVRASIEILLGSNAASNLIVGKPIDAGVSKELRRFAAIEKIIFDSKVPNQDLSLASGNVAYQALISDINNFTFAPPTNANVQALVSSADFPLSEKFNIEIHLVESLIRNYPLDRIPPYRPPASDKLTELAKASNLTDFNKKLNDNFEVGNTAWASESSMESVQKAACARLIELNQNNALKFTSPEHPLASRAYPNLIKLITNLPLAKQQALLDNPLALTALAAVENKFRANTPEFLAKAAENKNEIDRILGDKNLVDVEIITAAINESENLNRIAKIVNPRIISVLAQISPPVTLTTENVEAINRLLLVNPYRELESINSRNYQGIIQEIARNQAVNVQNNIYQAFGLQNNGDVAAQNKINYISTQHKANQHLVNVYNRPVTKPAEKVVILHLMTLDKGNFLTETHITNLLADIKTSKTLEEFIKLMKGPPERAYISGPNPPFQPALEQQLTPQLYERLKIDSRKKTFVNPDTYLEELNTQQDELDKLEEKFSETQLGFFDSRKLDRLTKITPFYWFNPAFQSSAKKHASQLGEELKDLSLLCDRHIIHLNNQLHALQIQLDSLPESGSIPASNEDMKNAIADRKEDLGILKSDISEELKRYSAMQELFKGKDKIEPGDHPLSKDGLLKIIDQAKAGKSDVSLNFTNTYSEDYDIGEKAKHFEQGWTSKSHPNSMINAHSLAAVGTDNYLFKEIEAIPAGKFREHSLSVIAGGREDKGSYIEEHSSTNIAPIVQKDGTIDYPPSVILTANKIMGTPEGKVVQAMQMAIDLVKKLNAPPTSDKPLLVLGSNDPVFAGYLWTALMVIGEDKSLKFGKDAIKVVSAHFDPESELRLGGLMWSGSSLYETQFKKHPNIAMMLEGIKDINQKKFGDIKNIEQAAKDTKSLTTSMKDRMFKIIDEDNKKHQESSRPTLGSGPGK
ncbi:MAG: hypothetical protein H0U57_02495 [Tatlockia sp.]|nr:hypothetical protein [Tatlockia sp.]